MDKITVMKSLESKFTSHNSVEVERATITREEFEAIKASQWISVEEQWPADETLVMCLDIHGRHQILQLIYTYDYHVEPVWLCENHSDEYDLEDITHWMPLPEGPTE